MSIPSRSCQQSSRYGGWIIKGRAFRSYYFMDWIHFTVCACFSFFASFLNQFDLGSAGWIHGLKLVAVAIVAHAIWGMARKLTPDRNRATIAILTAAIALLWPSSWTQVILIIICGFIGWFYIATNQLANLKI